MKFVVKMEIRQLGALYDAAIKIQEGKLIVNEVSVVYNKDTFDVVLMTAAELDAPIVRSGYAKKISFETESAALAAAHFLDKVRRLKLYEELTTGIEGVKQISDGKEKGDGSKV